MAENLKDDPAEINEFILDAARHKKPIFDSYKKLCEIQKNQEIDYVDFEWKYYQFHDGNQDLTIKRSPDNSSPVTFSDLPMDVLEKVVKKSNIVDCLALRKVCHDLRNLVDSTEIYCRRMSFWFQDRALRITFDNFEAKYVQTGDRGCRVSSGGWPQRNSQKYEEKRNYEQVMIADASTFLKNPKLKIDQLVFSVSKHGRWLEIEEFLESLVFRLDVRSISIYGAGELVLPIFRLSNLRTLKEIHIAGYSLTTEQFYDILETATWSMAEKVYWEGFLERFEMENWLQFKEIKINRFQFKDYFLINVRDVLLKSDNLELCQLSNSFYQDEWDYDVETNKQKVDRIMSQDPAYDAKTRRFSIPDSSDYFQLDFEGDDVFDALLISRNSRN